MSFSRALFRNGDSASKLRPAMNSKDSKFKDIRIILSNMAGLFAVSAIMLAAMAIVCYVIGEPASAPGFLEACVISLAFFLSLKLAFPVAMDLELRHAMIVAAAAYLLVPAVSAIPFVAIEHMAILDAFFEAISGWTGSGFTMILFPEHSPLAIQLWRSVTQWIGGIGVIVLMVTILIRPGTSTYIMYKSEARKERIMPSIRSTINTIWFLYLILTLAGVVMLILVGMPLWDSINHSMVAIGTGGFSIYSDSIAHYNSVPVEAVLMVIMFMGALPFIYIYKILKNPWNKANADVQVRWFVSIIVLGVALLTLETYLQSGQLFESLRVSAFQFISGVTCTGLQTSMMSDWSHTSLLILSLAMIIGGCAGSTAGGIKVARVIFLTSELGLWFKRTLMPRNAIVTIKMNNRRINEEVFSKELSEATLITFLWVITILAGVMIISHIAPPGYGLDKIIFTVCSAQGNVGLSVGIIEPGMHIIGKITIIVNMWIGRLEIIPVTLLIRYFLKGFRI